MLKHNMLYENDGHLQNEKKKTITSSELNNDLSLNSK